MGYYVKNIVARMPRFFPEDDFVFFLGDTASASFVPALPNARSLVVPRTWKRDWLEDMVKLPLEIRKQRAHLFHAPVVLGPLRSINMPFFSPVPVVATIHDLHVETLDDPHMIAYRAEFRYRLQRSAARRARIVTVSEATRIAIAGAGIADAAAVRVIPHGIDLPPDGPDQSIKENMVLFIGDAPHKNVLRAITVFSTVGERVPGWRFVAVGNRARIRGLAGAYADEAEHSGLLTLAGEIGDAELSALYRRASVLFMPSLSEGFGIPLLEAYAHGLCPVVSDREPMNGIGGDAAVYVDPEDHHEMVSSLEGLLRNPALRTIVTEKGRERIKRFTWETHCAALRTVYAEAVGHA
ncbi:MAG: hypothetical protein A2268_08350 [Candidatus Raymondbacteria bacterium RifOxyA12_full_50_37]|uniref:Glycosyltransferase subfamily 4-like N-terminal domain-containing protein n=1 Tax=Candidatus Raymondbacteria bacterium RIFOXYD12_FULL_49_13 TaxID=1817890 RepID=A0A1F7F3U6_UNCRA|nr:MAG: hypothetical protein A2268_08350 [Candidatus Raymondbacteria bacterium RifOxyA12_full_50_37]OGJ90344.1 MAG: hypothetical protein A2248_17285 [Candidatus Raymondbacteria bacterium RIFOXYA2_FULL_49_16]OGK01319.1 MAG: hypothetical protein A2519_13035 [Candidatus Raymondbacteria bacterium RIFOXYD12_FULL_49_13]OGP43243.1 MAG: hypothetical protein A2324_08115 [Candidatus Raymondbacteria bacterium RIFOXYB2_FULL_49_35]